MITLTYTRDNIFEQVQEFKYQGTTINSRNIIHGEINVILDSGNRCHYMINNLFKSKFLSKKIKVRYMFKLRLTYFNVRMRYMDND